MREVITIPSLANPSQSAQPQQLYTSDINVGSPSKVSTEELQQAMQGEIIPEMVKAMTGTIQRAQPPSQFSQEQLGDLIQSTVEDVIMKKAIPVMVAAMRSEIHRSLSAFMPVNLDQQLLPKVGHNPSSRSLALHAEASESRSLTLHFVFHLPDDGLYTLTNIQDHEGASLKVELRDSAGSRVEVGPEACAKIKLYVLRGDFDVDDRDEWTSQYFDNNVAKPRENKGPLLKGKCEIHMSNGVTNFSHIAFTDNSKPRVSGMFRLGARVIKGLPPGVLVRDAVSEAFKVRERRLKFCSKHKTPSLEDSTECLKHIGKQISKKLADSEQVHTVQDFLQLCNTNADKLQEVLQIYGKRWSELVNFAKLCSLTDKGYCYCDEESCSVLLLDCAFNIVGVVWNSWGFQPYKNLDDSQQKLVNKMRCAAYVKRHELPTVDIPSILTLLQAGSLSAASILHTVTQNPGTTTVEHPGISNNQRGHEGCGLNSNQTYQGQQGLLFSPPVSTPEPGTPFTSEPGLPTYQIQASSFQHQNFSTPPYSGFLDDQFRIPQMNNSQPMEPSANGPQDNTCQRNVECCKRARRV